MLASHMSILSPHAINGDTEVFPEPLPGGFTFMGGGAGLLVEGRGHEPGYRGKRCNDFVLRAQNFPSNVRGNCQLLNDAGVMNRSPSQTAH